MRRCVGYFVIGALCVLLGGCAGLGLGSPDFDSWEEAGRQLAQEAGATVVRVDRLEDQPGTMFDDDTSHVEVFATVDLEHDEATAELRAAGERLGYRVGDNTMSRDGSMIVFWIPPQSELPVELTIAAVDCDCP